jgi:hypothetical protein
LFTPMLHAKMMPLLSQVYHGKIGRDEAKLNEYGGQKLEAQVVPGGIKIAAISQVCNFRISCIHSLTSRPYRMIWSMILLSTHGTGGSWTGMLVPLRPRPCLTHQRHHLIWPNPNTTRVTRR